MVTADFVATEVMTDLEQSKYQVRVVFFSYNHDECQRTSRTVNGASAYMDGHLENGTSLRNGSSTINFIPTMFAGLFKFLAYTRCTKQTDRSRPSKTSSSVG